MKIANGLTEKKKCEKKIPKRNLLRYGYESPPYSIFSVRFLSKIVSFLSFLYFFRNLPPGKTLRTNREVYLRISVHGLVVIW